MRICTLDLETTDLAAVGAGWILCAVIKPLGGKPKVLRYDDMHIALAHETPLLHALSRVFDEYDMVIGHNLENFDWPYIKSRCSILGLPIPRPVYRYDTLQAFRSTKLRTVPNFKGNPKAGLGHVCDFFGLEQRKNGLFPRQHWNPVWGQDKGQRREALDHLVEHCVSDVIMNEAIYWKLLPLAKKYYVTWLY